MVTSRPSILFRTSITTLSPSQTCNMQTRPDDICGLVSSRHRCCQFSFRCVYLLSASHRGTAVCPILMTSTDPCRSYFIPWTCFQFKKEETIQVEYNRNLQLFIFKNWYINVLQVVYCFL
jgi:hypothetical protein